MYKNNRKKMFKLMVFAIVVILSIITYNDGTKTVKTTYLTVAAKAADNTASAPDDDIAPVFAPIINLYAQVNSEIDYLAGVSAADNSGHVEISVDASNVNPSRTGRYYIKYTATDPSGNKAEAGAYISISNKPPETVYALADKIITRNTSDDMTQYEKARKLYNWVINNVSYVNGPSKTAAIDGAYEAFTSKRGECFVFYSACEVLFTRAGIMNMQIRRLSSQEHYWNLVDIGGGWYHVDSCPINGLPRVRFMFPESTARYYTSRLKPPRSYNYDKSLYPEVEWE